MGDLLAKPNTEKKTESGEIPILKYGVCSMQGWRRAMEDSHWITLNLQPNNSTHIFAVFDGHGGREIAKYASKHFVEIFLSTSAYDNEDIKTALKQTFIQIDKNIQTVEGMKELTADHINFEKEFSIEPQLYPNKEGYINNIGFNIGCTANVWVIYNKEYYFANSGDSRSIILRNGEVRSMSVDHKPDLPNEFTRIKKAGGVIQEGRIGGALNLSRSLGDLQFKQKPELKPEEQVVTCVPDIWFDTFSKKDDFIVMACDGWWECMTNEDVADFIYSKFRNQPNVKWCDIACEMFNRNLAKNPEMDKGCDNMTCIIIQLKNKKKKVTEGEINNEVKQSFDINTFV